MGVVSRREFGGGLMSISALGCGAASGVVRQSMKREDWQPGYLKLEKAGLFESRIQSLKEIYRSCRLCPRSCGVNRSKGETGVCKLPARLRVYSAHAHFGEERVLVGRGGSGTIFFSRCNLLCVFCQNWEINHRGDGNWMSEDSLAAMMLSLQRDGCENINLVTPTHLVPGIMAAVRIAMQRGLRLPLVYNCGGYEMVEVIRLLKGIVDIYLPDFKYMDGAAAGRLSSGASDYPERAAESIAEMHAQVGEPVLDERGFALRGLVIRHLILPENLAGTDRFVRWVAANPGSRTSVNIMSQYRPAYQAGRVKTLSRRITREEQKQAQVWAREAGLLSIDGS
jgi:putative pyruvate formate lyase activating enzyme